MRFIILAAALCLAAPATAQQPDVDSIGEAARQRLLANQGDAQDYSLVLVHGGVRLPAYVYREGDGWHVEVPGESLLTGTMSMAVLWPGIASEMAREAEYTDIAGEQRYLGTDTIGGRLAHVLFAGFPYDGGFADSLYVYVDAESHQMLRIVMVGPADEEDEAVPFAGNMRVTVDLGDYTDHGGLVLPMRMRVQMNVDLALSPEERRETQESLSVAGAEVPALEGEAAEHMRAILELMEGLMLRGEIDLPVMVEEVRVNSGPPAWLDGGGM